MKIIKIEKAEIKFKCDKSVNHTDGKALRGFIGNKFENRVEFHQHIGKKFVYQHPMIQYKKGCLAQRDKT